MISRYAYEGGVWVDLELPDENEIRAVMQEFSISERIGSELLTPTPAPLVAGDQSASYLVLHFPVPRDGDGESKSQEVDFIVGPHFIITVRYELVIPFHQLKKQLETESAVTGASTLTTDVLLEVLFSQLYASVRDQVNHSAGRLTHVEKDMFDGRERYTVRAISGINRDFLHLEATLLNHEDPLTRFLNALSDRKVFPASFSERGARILAERAHAARLVQTYRAVGTELRETNTALLETRQNEIIKMLTAITVIILPLELIAKIFGMHALGTPLIGHPDAFWIILSIMLVIAGGTILVFAKKRWLF